MDKVLGGLLLLILSGGAEGFGVGVTSRLQLRVQDFIWFVAIYGGASVIVGRVVSVDSAIAVFMFITAAVLFIGAEQLLVMNPLTVFALWLGVSSVVTAVGFERNFFTDWRLPLIYSAIFGLILLANYIRG